MQQTQGAPAMFERLKGLFSARKESRTGAVIYNGLPDAEWSPRDYKAFADEGYQRNVIAFQAINKTALAVADIPVYITRANSDEVVADSPLVRLVKAPNPTQSWDKFIQSVVGFYRISGNAYIERTTIRGIPAELYSLRSDRMVIKPGQKGIPAAFKYKVGADSVTFEVDQISGASDIRHLKTFHPLSDWYGLSPIEAGAYGIDQHNETMKHIQALLQNGASPSGAMKTPPDKELSDDQYNRLKAEIDEKYTGSRNAGRPMLLEGGLDWVQMGFSPTDLAIIETKYSSARDISLALGVPPLLLNIPGDSTYSNYKEARLAFYEETVIPLANEIVSALNNWLSPLFDGQRINLDLDQIPAIADKRRELWTMADAATDLTINERREIKGYDEVEGGDAIYIDSNKIPLSFDLGEPDADPEDAAREAFGQKAVKQSFEPPQGVRDAAQRGLDYRDEFGRGGTEVGIARARDLSNGRPVSPETIMRMVSFFARHEDNRDPDGRESDGGPTNGWIAWLLWGGDPGREWANRIADRIEDAEDSDG